MAIIDYTYPNLLTQGWRVRVVRATQSGNIKSKEMNFNTKQEAFDYYELIRQMWQNQKER